MEDGVEESLEPASNGDVLEELEPENEPVDAIHSVSGGH